MPSFLLVRMKLFVEQRGICRIVQLHNVERCNFCRQCESVLSPLLFECPVV